jgi:ATP-dependent Clp protease ATP-binding subunit ClpA
MQTYEIGDPLFERFTERARQVVVLAQEEARRQECDVIGPKHILCALFREEEGIAARVLNTLGISYERAGELIEPGQTKDSKQIPFTDDARKALEFSLREALTMGHSYIGTEHILLGLVRQEENHRRPVAEFFESELAANKIEGEWSEIVRREIDEMLRGPRSRKVPEDLSPDENEEIDSREIIFDLITGYQIWRSLKGEEPLDDADEMLVRWISASKAQDYL